MMVIMILSLNEVSDDGDDGDFLFPTEVQVPRGLLLVRQLKDGFHHQGSPQDTDHDLERNDNVVYKQNYGYASKQSNSIALDYDISK